MWQQYRSTFFQIQTLIVLICAVLYFAMKVPPPAVVIFFLVMQVGSVLGAIWAVRLKRRVNASRESVPLR